MSVEYGLFNDEGCVERGFYTPAAAQLAAALYETDWSLTIEPLCPEHDEQPRDYCEECETTE